MTVSTVVVIDTETSGLDPEAGAGLMEIAWVALQAPESPDEDGMWGYGGYDSCYIEHVGPVDPAARATHHITDAQCAPGAPNCVSRESVIHDLLTAETAYEMVYAAHNAPFDRAFLKELTLPWIDTLQCARHIWPDAPGYSNQTLRYWRDVEPPADMLTESRIDHANGSLQKIPLQAHRALYDAAVTAALLREMLREYSPERLVELSTTPLLLRVCGFGKHKGTEWSKVPRDYLRFLSGTDMSRDPNLAYTVRHYLSA